MKINDEIYLAVWKGWS